MSRLDEISEREKRATPGEWSVQDAPGSFVEVMAEGSGEAIVAWMGFDNASRTYGEHARNACFIAGAKRDIPWLLANIRTAIRHIDATLEKHAGDIPRGELVKVWDILEGRVKTTEVSDADSK